MRELSATREQQIAFTCHLCVTNINEPSSTGQRKKQDIIWLIWSLYSDMCPMMDDTGIKQHSELDSNYLVLASIDTSSSDDESESDEGDVFSVSCHGSHFKQLKEQPKQCDELAIKRRKLQTQLNLLNSDLLSMTFGGSRTSADQPPCGLAPDKRIKKLPRNKRLTRKIDAGSKTRRRISPRTAWLRRTAKGWYLDNYLNAWPMTRKRKFQGTLLDWE